MKRPPLSRLSHQMVERPICTMKTNDCTIFVKWWANEVCTLCTVMYDTSLRKGMKMLSRMTCHKLMKLLRAVPISVADPESTANPNSPMLRLRPGCAMCDTSLEKPASRILCSPNEDFGRPSKHSGTYFQSTFHMREYSIWATFI